MRMSLDPVTGQRTLDLFDLSDRKPSHRIGLADGEHRQDPSEPEIEPWLAPGTEVVLKDPETLIRDREWLAPCRDHLTFRIETVQGERLLVVAHDKTQGGWLRRDQVVALESAIDYFTREIDRIPHHADAYWMRGRVWAYRGEDQRAIADFDQAIQFRPNQAPYYLRCRLVLIRTRHLDQALGDCDKAIELDPKAGGLRASFENPALARRDPSEPRPTSTRPSASTLSSHRISLLQPRSKTSANSTPAWRGHTSSWP